MSLLASLMSAAALLGAPSEIYSYGTMYIYWSNLLSIGHRKYICKFVCSVRVCNWYLSNDLSIYSDVSSNGKLQYICGMLYDMQA
jgi:hypothetical protein